MSDFTRAVHNEVRRMAERGELPVSPDRIYSAAPNYYGVLDDGALRLAIGAVIDRWYRAKLLRFNTHDDGSDDLFLRDEIWRAVRAALDATKPPEPAP